VNDTALALEDAVATAATGDILPFRGRSMADLTIRALTNSPVNHVGMAVAIDDPPPQLWHAEFDRSLPDVWTGERHRGVQRRDAGRQNPSVGRRLSPCDQCGGALRRPNTSHSTSRSGRLALRSRSGRSSGVSLGGGLVAAHSRGGAEGDRRRPRCQLIASFASPLQTNGRFR